MYMTAWFIWFKVQFWMFLKVSQFRKDYLVSSILSKSEQKQFDLRYHLQTNLDLRKILGVTNIILKFFLISNTRNNCKKLLKQENMEILNRPLVPKQSFWFLVGCSSPLFFDHILSCLDYKKLMFLAPLMSFEIGWIIHKFFQKNTKKKTGKQTGK